MLIFLGLGNPGKTYLYNRHNVGHRFIDYFKDNSSPLLESVAIFKTNTFMNTSGIFARSACKNPGPLWIAHDDLEVQVGEVKWKWGGGAAGHNGIRSIIDKCGSENGRIRIGIGRPLNHISVADYVLNDHDSEELQVLENLHKHLTEFICDNITLFRINKIDEIRTKWKKFLESK